MKILKPIYYLAFVLIMSISIISSQIFFNPKPPTPLPRSLYSPLTTWDKYPKISTAPTGPFSQTTKAATVKEGYSFFATVGHGVPVRWNPCLPILYQVNPKYLPPHALKMLKITFKDLTAATGISFGFQGFTSKVPFAYSPNTSRSPIVIAWRPLKGSLGDGAPVIEDKAGKYQIIGGSAIFSANQWSSLNLQQRYALIHHELGHVMGLFHVNDPTQVMNPTDTVNAPATYGAGDLKGLAYLGLNEGCIS